MNSEREEGRKKERRVRLAEVIKYTNTKVNVLLEQTHNDKCLMRGVNAKTYLQVDR